jgi:hypothetical protein
MYECLHCLPWTLLSRQCTPRGWLHGNAARANVSLHRYHVQRRASYKEAAVRDRVLVVPAKGRCPLGTWLRIARDTRGSGQVDVACDA